ncbi:hypothetical protein [Streptomyces sp. NPDC058674]|uniref:hypothetical protein n=1 Tax=Streptomyces sp. NPDC058674 TaxID=3346592 RepID=UPI00364EBDD5
MTGRPCDIPGDGHDGAVRLYPGGWHCTTHAPTPRPRTAPTTAVPVRLAPAAPAAPVDPVGPVMTGGLFIDCGRRLPDGVTWVQPPRARYECRPCRYASPEVAGLATVLEFLATARAHHHAIHHTTSRGAQAA